MEGFVTTKEAAENWNIFICQAQNYCKNRRIKAVLCGGTNYLIPKDAMKPTYTYVYESEDPSNGQGIMMNMIQGDIIST